MNMWVTLSSCLLPPTHVTSIVTRHERWNFKYNRKKGWRCLVHFSRHKSSFSVTESWHERWKGRMTMSSSLLSVVLSFSNVSSLETFPHSQSYFPHSSWLDIFRKFFPSKHLPLHFHTSWHGAFGWTLLLVVGNYINMLLKYSGRKRRSWLCKTIYYQEKFAFSPLMIEPNSFS